MENQPLASTTEQATLVQAAASASGLGDGRYRLLRVSTNIVYTNDEDRVVARVAPSHETVDAANDRLRNIELLIWLYAFEWGERVLMRGGGGWVAGQLTLPACSRTRSR